MQTKRKNGDLNKVLNEISAYLSDISNIGNITHYYWKTGIYAEKLLKLCYGKEAIVFPVDIKKITDKLGIWIEDVDINDFSNEHIKRPNHKIAQLSVQESFFSNEREAVIYTDKYVPAA